MRVRAPRRTSFPPPLPLSSSFAIAARHLGTQERADHSREARTTIGGDLSCDSTRSPSSLPPSASLHARSPRSLAMRGKLSLRTFDEYAKLCVRDAMTGDCLDSCAPGDEVDACGAGVRRGRLRRLLPARAHADRLRLSRHGPSPPAGLTLDADNTSFYFGNTRGGCAATSSTAATATTSSTSTCGKLGLHGGPVLEDPRRAPLRRDINGDTGAIIPATVLPACPSATASTSI